MKTCSICSVAEGSEECGDLCPDPDTPVRCNRQKEHEGDHAWCDGGVHPVFAWRQKGSK